MCPYYIKGFMMLICLIAGHANGERGEERGTEEREILRNWSPTVMEAGKPTVDMVGQQSGGQWKGDI